MNTVEEKTRELGEALQQSEEMKRYKAAEIKQSEDEEAAALMQEYNVKRMNLARDMQNGNIDRAEAVQRNNEEFDKLLEKSETIKEFVEAKKEFDLLVQKMNQMLNFYITGQSGSCSGSCGTCGGCS